jgi:hypothetical protein
MACREARRWSLLAERHLALGDAEKAVACCVKSLAARPETDAAISLMAKALMPGDDYLAILSRFHELLRPQSYVEIGVAHGDSLTLAKPETHAVGIDPCPQIRATIRSHARLYPIPSDDFFARYELLRELESPRLALGFIDGLHVFEQALKDFINVERCSDKGTVVLVHDCLPVSRLMASRERHTGYWSGDIWKIVLCLAKYRPDLSLGVIPAYPSGLLLITSLDPRSSVLSDRLEAIIAEYKDQSLPYEYLDHGSMSTVLPAFWPTTGRRSPRWFLARRRENRPTVWRRSRV